MFGKNKKNAISPVEEMEKFYLNQFLNSPKTQPQGANRMNQGPGMFNVGQPHNFNSNSQPGLGGNTFPSNPPFNNFNTQPPTNQPYNNFNPQSLPNQPYNNFNPQPLPNQPYNNFNPQPLPNQPYNNFNPQPLPNPSLFPRQSDEMTSLIEPSLEDLGHEPKTDPIPVNDEVYNRVDNINIRLRKVESYLGLRPDHTI